MSEKKRKRTEKKKGINNWESQYKKKEDPSRVPSRGGKASGASFNFLSGKKGKKGKIWNPPISRSKKETP